MRDAQTPPPGVNPRIPLSAPRALATGSTRSAAPSPRGYLGDESTRPHAGNTKTATDGAFDLRAQATDADSTLASNAPLNVSVDDTRPTAKSVATTNRSCDAAGELEADDSVKFTYAETMKSKLDSVVLERLTDRRARDGLGTSWNLWVWDSTGATQTTLVIPLALGGMYTAGPAHSTRRWSDGTVINATLGNLVGGVLGSSPVTGGTLK